MHIDGIKVELCHPLQVREYMMALEGQRGEARRQARRLLKRQAELGGAMAEFGGAMAALGTLEQGRLASAFPPLGDKAAAVASTSQVTIWELV